MIEFRKNSRYEVLTPSGYQKFSGMRKTTKEVVIELTLSNNQYLEVSKEHRFITQDNQIVKAQDLIEGIFLTEFIKVDKVEFKEKNCFLYDLTDVGTDSVYYTDGVKSHNCDFLSSGDTVFLSEDMAFYETTCIIDPVERRGVDGNLWVWETPDYTKDYMVVADVARGDSSDYSTFHVIDIETANQVAEYKGKLSPKDFGNVLVGIASEYNDALLVVENANIGWATIEQILAREYRNLYYSSRSDQETVESYMNKFENDRLVPGFTQSARTRPLVIAKMMEYVRDHSVRINSKRLLEEMRVFVWKNGKAQAQTNYNDDLIMAFAIGLYVRDTALRLRQQGMDLARAQLSSIASLNQRTPTVYSQNYNRQNPYQVDTPGGKEDISWLLK
jgi:hypothetical protein